MGRPLFTLIPHNARAWYHLRYRFAVVFFLVALFHQQHMYIVSRWALRAKYSPTNFNIYSGDLQPRFSIPDDQDSQLQDELVANRAAWKVLGKGCEGKVFAYKDLVIKTYTPGRSPFRNCAPDAATATKWPTEIPASLHFGGSSRPVDVSEDASVRTTNATYQGFLPVKTYFMASTTPGDPAEWHLVTPLLKGSNLNALASYLSTSAEASTFRDVDALYRPAFNRFLGSMQALHDAGFCHDDIKTDNIFVQDESHWVVGDLGNVRELLHPYHSSRIWKENGQLGDCRANDVFRTLQSYLKFIQLAVADQDTFNMAFYEGEEPMSRLFWWTLANAQSMSAEKLRERSITDYPDAAPRLEHNSFFRPTRPHTLLSLFSRQSAVRRAVDEALATRMPDKKARWWGMVWLFGVPDSGHCEA